MARILGEPHPLHHTEMDSELLRIVRRWEPTAERDWSVSSTIGEVRISPDRFEAALDCLLENAIKFTKPEDRIEVTGRREHDGWSVQVRDTGVGISAEKLQRLLESAPGQGTSTGTGLGLAIVRAVVEPLGGRITISSAPQAGTSVTLYVPQTAPDLPATARPEPVVAQAAR